MGGDHAPDEIVAGALRAHVEGIHILLAGPSERLEKLLADAGTAPDSGLEVVDAQDVIAMDDHDPARAVRSRRNSSIGVACRLVSDGRADAVFSAGSTGAALAGAVLETGRIRGVARPAIALVLPFPNAPTVLVDAGANADVRPEHLVGFALLGSTFATVRLGVETPRVGLLSVGEEPGKGNELAKTAYPLLQEADVQFIGNVEGRDIPSERVDVVVTDGFTGNIALKLMEGTARAVASGVREAARSNPIAALGGLMLRPALGGLRSRMDPNETGGAILLGLRGVAVVAHGSSTPDGIANAIRLAQRSARERAVERTGELLEASGATREALRRPTEG